MEVFYSPRRTDRFIDRDGLEGELNMRGALGSLLFLAATSVWAQAPPPFAIVDAAKTVQIEHEDRMRRLSALAGLQGQQAPAFFSYNIPQHLHKLKIYPIDLPVLRVIFNEDAFFASDRDELTPSAYRILNVIAASLQQEPPDVTIFVAGHTDALGAASYNLELGLRRARVVTSALVRIGISRAQIYQVSFGEAVPIASNADQSGRARNRRVEFLFAARPEAIAAWLATQSSQLCAPILNGENGDCAPDLHFRAESVSIQRPNALPYKRQTARAEMKQKDPEVVEEKNYNIDIGRTKIDINLAEKLFTIRLSK